MKNRLLKIKIFFSINVANNTIILFKMNLTKKYFTKFQIEWNNSREKTFQASHLPKELIFLTDCNTKVGQLIKNRKFECFKLEALILVL